MNRFRSWILTAVVLALAASTWAAEAPAPQPDAAKPDAAKPDAAKPDAAKPDAAKPDAAKPEAKKPGSLVAVVKQVTGTVETRPAVDQPWVPVKVDMKLAEGADLRTGFRARCILDMVDSLVQIDPLTVVRIGELVRQEGNKIRTRLIMKQGNAGAIVEKEHIESDFAIVTPSATLSVRGTKNAWAIYFPDTGGAFGLVGPGLVGVRDFLLGKETLCGPGQNTNDNIDPPIKMLQGNFLPVILAAGGLGKQEKFAAGRWHTSNPLPGGLLGPAGPPNLSGKNGGQQKNPILPILPIPPPNNGCENGRGDITYPPE